MSTLTSILACPRCGISLDKFHCKACQLEFPIIEDIPWLFADPDAARTDWRNRWNLALADLNSRLSQAKIALAGCSSTAKPRLNTLVTGYEKQIHATRELLAGLALGPAADLTTYLALKTRLPPQAELFSYDANVFRDWCWGDTENLLSLEAIIDILDGVKPRRILTLGSGAGRLSYDLHQHLNPELSVAMDMNPLLATVARRLAAGDKVDLVEFPRAPVDGASVAISRSLYAPEKASAGFEVVLADAMRPPFQPGSFDLVVTPWLLDVIDASPAEFIKGLNPLLRPGGLWIHHGSLAFTHADPAQCPDLAELRELNRECGFGEQQSSEITGPYLDSPVSRHARRETLVTLRATKISDCGELPRYQALPDWLAKGRAPIPLLPAFQTQAMTTRIHAFIMTLVDGQRSLQDIARVLEEQQLMPKADAEVAIRGFLIKMFEEALQRGR